MYYQFPLIRSTFSIKTKKWLAGLASFIYLLRASLPAPFILQESNSGINEYLVYIGILVISYFIFILKAVDRYKIIGKVLFNDKGITIGDSDQFIAFEEIAMFYFIPSAIYGGYRESTDTYFLQIAKKDTTVENIHVTRTPYINNKLKKIFIWKKYDDLFNVLKKTGIKYRYKKNKYFG